jgi:outer membrane protein assembly factor BamB/tetratricopeptide (TPR) repeat protein
MDERRAARRTASAIWMIAGAAALVPIAPGLLSPAAIAQTAPVYVDDSIPARESLLRARELLAAGNIREAARIVQWVLDAEGGRVLETESDPRLYEPVRAQVHAFIISTPELLARYRLEEEPRAKDLLDRGLHSQAEATRLLTTSGFEAALRVAQERLEAGDFEAALLTLRQLEDHPDRRGAGIEAGAGVAAGPASAAGQAAAELALTLARYIDRESVREWARRWSAESGMPDQGPPTQVPTPAALREPSRTPLDPAPVGPKIAARSPLVLTALEPDAEMDGGRIIGNDEAWTYPTIVGDVVYINNGAEIMALDRYTLETRWRTRPPLDDFLTEEDVSFVRGRSMSMEDVQFVSASRGVVVGATGVAMGGRRDGDRRMHALTAATGAVLWSIDPAQLDRQLEGTNVRGPILVSGDTAIVSLRKRVPQRRVASVYMIGVGLFDGSLRWTRLVGTAGIFPGGRNERVADAAVLSDGVVYRVDELGAVTAIEASSGRVVWVRRYDNEAGWASTGRIPLAAAARPVLTSSSLFFVRPGGQEIVQLDRASGRLIASRPANMLGDALYLLAVGDSLVGVGRDRVGVVPIRDLAQGTARLSPSIPGADIRGRAIAADGKVVIPVKQGLAVIDPAAPDVITTIELETSGATLIDNEYVLVADDAKLSAYVAWDRVERVLRDRMDAAPTSEAAALSLVRLSARAGRVPLVIEAADRALKALDAAPATDELQAGRRKLFELLLGLVEASLRGGRGELPTLALDQIEPLIPRLLASMVLPEERAAALLVRGELEEQRGAPGRAIEAYQEILADADLRGVRAARGISSPERELLAGDDAVRRVREAVSRGGFAAYLPFDQEAQRSLDALGPNPSRDELEKLGRRYPAAGASVDAWSRLAAQDLTAKEEKRAITALQAGFQTAETMVRGGRADMGPRLTTLAAQIVGLLLKADRPSAAARMLAETSTIGLAPDAAASMASLSRDVAVGLSAQTRPPTVGLTLSETPVVLDGWNIMDAPGGRQLQPAIGRALDHVLLDQPTERRIGLWALSPDGSDLQLAWTRPYDAQPPRLLRLDGQSALLFHRSTQGGHFESIATANAASWKTEDISVWFGPATADASRDGRDPAVIESPQDGQARIDDLIIAADATRLAVARRGGRVGVLDLETGKGLWTLRTPFARIYDVSVGQGLVVISGVGSHSPIDAGAQAPIERAAENEPRVVAFDVATGDERFRAAASSRWGGSGLAGGVRWTRLLPQKKLLVGTSDGLVMFDLATSRVVWSAVGPPGADSTEAWIFNDRIVLLDRDGDVWMFRTIDGSRVESSLDTKGRLSEQRDMEAFDLGDRIALTSPRGMIVFNQDGESVGADPLGAARPLLRAAHTRDMILSVEAERQTSDSLPVHREVGPTEATQIHGFEPATGRMLLTRKVGLFDDPRTIVALDGKILIGTPSMTVVISATE